MKQACLSSHRIPFCVLKSSNRNRTIVTHLLTRKHNNTWQRPLWALQDENTLILPHVSAMHCFMSEFWFWANPPPPALLQIPKVTFGKSCCLFKADSYNLKPVNGVRQLLLVQHVSVCLLVLSWSRLWGCEALSDPTSACDHYSV